MALEIIQHPSGNYGYPRGRSGRNGYQAIAICNHTMDGYEPAYHAIIADEHGNAANYSVYRDGHIEQHCMVWFAAWCNGEMHLPDLSVPWIADCWHHHINPNLMTISIEHEGLWNESLTEKQILSTIALQRHLVAEFRILTDRNHIVGHNQIDSVNKRRCPGPLFPWRRLMAALVG